MATATTLLEDACDTGIACLTDRDLLVAIAQALADSLGMTATELLQAACTSGLSCLQDRDLLVTIAEGINQGGGGGGGVQQVYTGAAPPAAPDNPALPALYYPTGGGTVLQWDGAAWV